MGAEQRRQKRLRLDLPVYVTLLEEVMGFPTDSEGKLHDLSVGGCSFLTDHEIPVGSRIQVRITLNDQLAQKFHKPELTARGAICRVSREHEGFVLSVRFLHPQDGH